MSERANGWLLIFGGLAIGLVLWLSPSQGAIQHCGNANTLKILEEVTNTIDFHLVRTCGL